MGSHRRPSTAAAELGLPACRCREVPLPLCYDAFPVRGANDRVGKGAQGMFKEERDATDQSGIGNYSKARERARRGRKLSKETARSCVRFSVGSVDSRLLPCRLLLMVRLLPNLSSATVCRSSAAWCRIASNNVLKL